MEEIDARVLATVDGALADSYDADFALQKAFNAPGKSPRSPASVASPSSSIGSSTLLLPAIIGTVSVWVCCALMIDCVLWR